MGQKRQSKFALLLVGSLAVEFAVAAAIYGMVRSSLGSWSLVPALVFIALVAPIVGMGIARYVRSAQ